MTIADHAPARLLELPEPDAVRAVIDPNHTWFRQHLVRGRRILPGIVCLELALQGVTRSQPGARVYGIADAAWLRPISGDEPLDDLVLRFRADADRRTVHYAVGNRGTHCSMGALLLERQDRPPAVPLAVRDEICENTRDHFTRREVYDQFARMGIDYGGYFRRITYVQRCGQRSLAWLSGNDGTQMDLVNLLDCSFQVGMAISIGEHRDSLMPYSLGCLVFHAPLRFPLHSAFVLTEKHSPFRTSFTVFDENYAPLVSVFDLGVKPAV